MTGGAPTRLDSLTSLRFLAAAVVVLSHSTRDLADVPILSTVASGGSVGVGFFFALSGFVLAWSHRPGDRPVRFYRRRFARVYPMHFLTYVLAFPVLLLAGTNMGAASVNAGAAVASPLLIQAWFPQPEIHYGMNAPSWSLSNEAFFYLLFPVILPMVSRLSSALLRLFLVVIPGVVLMGSLLWAVSMPATLAEFLYIDPAWRLLGFVAGVVLAESMRRGMRSRISMRSALLIVSVAFLLLPAFVRLVQTAGVPELAAAGVYDAVMLPLFLVLIAAGASADLRGTERWIASPWLIRLGEWSFALYLTHWLLIDLVVGLAPAVRDLPALASALANVALLLLAVAVSGVFYQTVEKPLERLLRGSRPRPEEAPRIVTPQSPPPTTP